MNKLRIKTLLRETFMGEAETQEVDNEKERKSMTGLYKRVQRRLENPLFNHAEIMRQLGWEGDENTNRSLFEKKLKRAKNDSGGTYEFEPEELKKILTILDAGSQER